MTKSIMSELLASGTIRPSAVTGLDFIALMEKLNEKNLRTVSYNSETKPLVPTSKRNAASGSGLVFAASSCWRSLRRSRRRSR